MNFQKVIDLKEKPRTADVTSTGSFEALMISPQIIENLYKFNFRTPSPVQQRAIPAGLSGLDLLVQAKSGTGKTLVFSVLAVENLNTQSNATQRLILAPTREIATQIKDTVKRIAHHRTRIAVLVGGTPLSLDIQSLKRGAHIVIGTTGRISQMVQLGHLSLDQVDLFVLDEADKLMDECFHKDINYLFSCLPPTRQVAVFSATYPKGLDKTLSNYMRDVTLVRLNSDDVQLVGIKQYVSLCFEDSSVIDSLIRLLRNVSFEQAVIFCNFHQDCEEVSTKLSDAGFDSVFISSQIKQSERESIMEKLKSKKIKVLVSTDLTARGIDAEDVNLVVNLEAAINVETYFHRIGRAARFGGLGAAVTLLRDEKALSCFRALVASGNVNVRLLEMDALPHDITTNAAFHQQCTTFVAPSKRSSKTPDAAVNSTTTRYKKDLDAVAAPIAHYVASGNCSYDRSAMMGLREYSPKPTSSLAKRIFELGLATTSDYGSDLQQMIVDMKQLKTSNFSKSANDEKENQPSKQAPKKFKFVPSREKAKKKFYLRGELLSIRDSVSAEVWREIAEKKFDLSTEPFSLAPVNVSVPSVSKPQQKKKKAAAPVSAKPKEVISRDKDAAPSRISPDSHKLPSTSAGSDIKKYSRKDLIAIQMKTPKATWLSYAKSRWDTSEDPWQLDPHLRCPFDEQLRRIRQREKQQRAKVMADRQKAISERSALMASSRSITRPQVKEESFNDFCANWRTRYEQFEPPTNGNSTRMGSVVPIRDSPQMWKDRVSFYTSWLKQVDSMFKYDVRKAAAQLAEAECCTGDDLLSECELPPSVDGRESGAVCSLSSVKEEEESATEIVSAAHDLGQPKAAPPTCSCSEAEEQGMKEIENELEAILAETDASFAEPEPSQPTPPPISTSTDCANPVLSSESEEEQLSEVDRLARFAASYRRNVDFNVVFSSYFSMMNGSFR